MKPLLATAALLAAAGYGLSCRHRLATRAAPELPQREALPSAVGSEAQEAFVGRTLMAARPAEALADGVHTRTDEVPATDGNPQSPSSSTSRTIAASRRERCSGSTVAAS